MTCISRHPAPYGPLCSLPNDHDGEHRATVPTDEYFTTVTWPNPEAERRAADAAREAERVRHPAWCPAWWNTRTDAFPCDCGRTARLATDSTLTD